MKRLQNYLPLHFVVYLILGIYTQFSFQFWHFGFLELLVLVVLLISVLLLTSKKIIRTILAFIIFFFIGISSVYINNDSNYKDYYQNFSSDNNVLVLQVNKVLKTGNYHYKYEVEVRQINQQKTRGKVLLNVAKDSIKKPLQVDEFIFLKTNFSEVPKSLNPHQFDYKLYLKKRGIYQQIYIQSNEFKRINNNGFSLSGLSAKFRSKIQLSLQEHRFSKDEFAIINALLLGQRQEASKELISNYSKAGAIHILAVSGLHVGIILLILTQLLKPLERIKYGKVFKAILIIILLWSFAFIAGLSASVVRAVTMFTFIALGASFKKKKVNEFSLISSMFLLLICKPMFLFDIGFQLSYLAVFGIIWVYPSIHQLYKSRFFIDKKAWEIICVSCAAQIGVLPLSLYYFHQFPGLFFLANLFIIPFLSAILIGGIVIISLSLIGFLPQFLASAYGFVIATMNNFIAWISKQEQFLFSEISLSFLMLISLYVLIIFSISFFIKKTAKRLLYFLVAFVIVQSVVLYENHQRNSVEEFIVFHKSRSSILGQRFGKNQLILHDIDTPKIVKLNAIQSYRIDENVHQSYKRQHQNIYRFKNENILVIDSLGVYQLNNVKSSIVILQYSPKINLERMIKTIQPKKIVADGSNYKSYVKRWQEIAKKQKTPFHYTGEDGAFKY
ncbi:ComEC/Rec2 family competence protein [Polaribacter porphyrae]|uniref:Competence protein n=1 Tax=Polaribacter porphyrae TaxID=1137780 RepID=A0A2S7WT40_9FLAO|nr:ComEC/Rec2 family competence protein [Polaribacter porphyrae]PQJ80768.1 competence protein [Polaribacter porphyrae]